MASICLSPVSLRLSCLYPSVGCLVMGSGEQRAEAEERIREAGLEENILLLGDVTHDACLALMSACDVFLRPTLEDGDSISVREALSLGVPVVASRVGTRRPAPSCFTRAMWRRCSPRSNWPWRRREATGRRRQAVWIV